MTSFGSFFQNPDLPGKWTGLRSSPPATKNQYTHQSLSMACSGSRAHVALAWGALPHELSTFLWSLLGQEIRPCKHQSENRMNWSACNSAWYNPVSCSTTSSQCCRPRNINALLRRFIQVAEHFDRSFSGKFRKDRMPGQLGSAHPRTDVVGGTPGMVGFIYFSTKLLLFSLSAVQCGSLLESFRLELAGIFLD